MIKKSLDVCPACNAKLIIKEYECPHCNVTIRGEFQNSVFNRLNAEQLEFVKVFILAQGNIREVENKLKISYPTVKNKLNELIKILQQLEIKHKKESVINILEELENGFINIAEAIEKINHKKKGI
ncbi:MAG: DUF2089 domain-containing protein [Candidatus Cloacimonetes bacterium]|jgi:hypothetical protein|nr:DUF2089 domain-containing protein [Candidatus Cloacimonadota bacterium]